MKIFNAQQGIVQIPLLVVLVVGIIIGVVLVQKQTNVTPQANECKERPACLDAARPCKIMEPKGGWCVQASSTPKATCTSRPSCLDSNPRCLIAEPTEGWCPSASPRSCTKVKSVTPNISCGKNMYRNAAYVCGDGTRGQISSGSLWGRPTTAACKSLAELNQDALKKCLNHAACQPEVTPPPTLTPTPFPTVTPTPSQEPEPTELPQ